MINFVDIGACDDSGKDLRFTSIELGWVCPHAKVVCDHVTTNALGEKLTGKMTIACDLGSDKKNPKKWIKSCGGLFSQGCAWLVHCDLQGFEGHYQIQGKIECNSIGHFCGVFDYFKEITPPEGDFLGQYLIYAEEGWHVVYGEIVE